MTCPAMESRIRSTGRDSLRIGDRGAPDLGRDSRIPKSRQSRAAEVLGIALAAPCRFDDSPGHKLTHRQFRVVIEKGGDRLVIGIAHGRYELGSESVQARPEL